MLGSLPARAAFALVPLAILSARPTAVLVAGEIRAVRADTTDYLILNHGREAGAMRVVSEGDSVVVQYDYQDRQRGPHTRTRYLFAPDGTVRSIRTGGLATGNVASSAAGEQMERVGEVVRWRSDADSGEVRAPAGAVYRLRSANPYDIGVLARQLLARPGGTAPALPVGTVRAVVAADTTLSVGGRPERLRLVLIDEGSLGADGVWLDDRGAVVASPADWFPTVRRDALALLPTLRAIESAYHARRSAALATRLTPTAPSALVIRNGNVFDAERGVMLPGMTVVVKGDRIVALGPAATTATPAGATVIDATGKSVIPGLWEMHLHLGGSGETEVGAMQLAAGVTTARDLASDVDHAVSQRDRAASGTLLSPRLILAGFLEGPGFWAGPSEALVRTEADARAWVARYDSLGYRQIKLYNLVHPDLVPTIVAEARRRGMRVSGHVPRGLTLQNAVELGFDEVQHIAFLVSTFYQDSLYLPQMRAYSQVAAAVAPTFDVEAPRVDSLLAFLKSHNTVIDPTLGAFHSGTPLADGSDPIFGPTKSWFSPAERRAMQRAAPDPRSPASIAARGVDATYARLVKRMFDAGISLVAGTDHAIGVTYHGELELYQQAGIPAPAVLQIATINAARVMKEDRDYGSIAVGKVADLAIVDGQPAERISDVRRTEIVVRGGRVYRSADLYAAAGVTPAW
jgi:imidazolonepropionase-like amidohydrolase